MIVSASLTRGGVALATNDEDSNVVSGDNGGGAVIVPLRVPAVNDDGGGSVGHVLRVIGRFAGEAGTVFKVREGRTLFVCFRCFDGRELSPLSPMPLTLTWDITGSHISRNDYPGPPGDLWRYAVSFTRLRIDETNHEILVSPKIIYSYAKVFMSHSRKSAS